MHQYVGFLALGEDLMEQSGQLLYQDKTLKIYTGSTTRNSPDQARERYPLTHFALVRLNQFTLAVDESKQQNIVGWASYGRNPTQHTLQLG